MWVTEGGFAPSLKTNRDGVEVVLSAMRKAGYRRQRLLYRPGLAASEFLTREICPESGRRLFKSWGNDCLLCGFSF